MKRKTKTLIQTEKCSIIYGTFNGEENQELFRCPRKLDEDLENYINKNRVCVGFENDNKMNNLHEIDGYLGYYRLYFRGGWYGRWFFNEEKKEKIDNFVCAGVDEIIEFLMEKFPYGCNWEMVDWLEKFEKWGVHEHVWLLKPKMSKHYKVCFNTEFMNGDYPVRIYCYE